MILSTLYLLVGALCVPISRLRAGQDNDTVDLYYCVPGQLVRKGRLPQISTEG